MTQRLLHHLFLFVREYLLSLRLASVMLVFETFIILVFLTQLDTLTILADTSFDEYIHLLLACMCHMTVRMFCFDDNINEN